MSRYYCPDPRLGLLSPRESHHCRRVHRNKPGELISVFDGQGKEWLARLTEVKEGCCRFQLLEMRASPKPSPWLVAGLGLVKGRALEWAVEKSVELGVNEIHLLSTARSVVRWTKEETPQKLAHWEAVVIEAAKQCGQLWLPHLFPPKPVAAFLAELPQGGAKLLASLGSEAIPFKDLWPKLPIHDPVWVMVGPEGDFTPEEEELARKSGFLPVSLGPLTLRSETALLALAAALRLLA
jgi:16S rRNA (uracil1498-N3)-methyltransferase